MKAIAFGCARCGALRVNLGTGLCDRCELVIVMKSQRRKYEREHGRLARRTVT